MSYLGLRTWNPVWNSKSQLPSSQWLRWHGLTSSDLGLKTPCEHELPTNALHVYRWHPHTWKRCVCVCVVKVFMMQRTPFFTHTRFSSTSSKRFSKKDYDYYDCEYYYYNYYYNITQLNEYDHKKKREDDSNVATNMDYGVASISGWSKSTCNLIICNMRIKRPLKTIASFKKWIPWTCANTYLPEGKHMGSHMVGWNNMRRPRPTMIGWTVDGRVHWKSSLGKVTYPSTTPAFRNLT